MSHHIDHPSFYGYHFGRDDRRLGYGDGRMIEVGAVFEVDPPIRLCGRGLHASEKPLDALIRSPGGLVSLVRLEGEILRDTSQACATRRVHLVVADATQTLLEFADWCIADAVRVFSGLGWPAYSMAARASILSVEQAYSSSNCGGSREGVRSSYNKKLTEMLSDLGLDMDKAKESSDG